MQIVEFANMADPAEAVYNDLPNLDLHSLSSVLIIL